MKGRLFVAILKSLTAMAGLFAIGYLGYHYPDSMIYVISIGTCCAFSWFFYIKEKDE